MSEAEQPERFEKCALCRDPLRDITRSTFRGSRVHNSCFEKKGRRHRLSSRRGATRRLKAAAKRAGMPLRAYARTTSEGAAWFNRKRG